MSNNRDGLLVVDKVKGMSSFDVVRRVRGLAKTRKVGHTGTLDPDATGVLPVAIGRCTKLSKYLTLDDKRYSFTMKLGAATTTDDSTGEVVRQAGFDHVTRADVEALVPRFVGHIEQVPPVYSAIKVDGERAYARARKGEDVQLEARTVRVDALEITGWDLPHIEMEVRCGPGTYVRSLARDIGEALGSAAHTTAIHRSAVGPFTIDKAVSLQTLQEAEDIWEYVLTPMEMVSSLPRVPLDAEQTRRVGHGQRLVVERQWPLDTAVAAHDEDGRLVAVMIVEKREGNKSQLKPKRVLMPLRG